MGKRGPRRTPTSILQARGSSWASRRKGELKPDAGEPVMPTWLDDAAKTCWQQLVDMYRPLGLLTLLDANALARYCRTWSRWVAVEQFLVTNGPTYPVTDANGNLKRVSAYPEVAISRQLAEQLRRLEIEFGMTPSSRANLDIEKPSPAKSEIEEFIAQRFD
jgi:P27 family predicted phage terminase small subunit